MSKFKQYRRKGLAEMRPYIPGEDLSSVSVNEVDDPPNDLGMIARNPKNHANQWYVARKYFFEPANAYVAQSRDPAARGSWC
jgi:hypothetical protein